MAVVGAMVWTSHAHATALRRGFSSFAVRVIKNRVKASFCSKKLRSRFRLFLIISCKRKSFGLGTKPCLDLTGVESETVETFQRDFKQIALWFIRDAKQLKKAILGQHFHWPTFRRGRSLDVQSEKPSDYNYHDYYADDVEDVHLVCSSWNPA